MSRVRLLLPFLKEFVKGQFQYEVKVDEEMLRQRFLNDTVSESGRQPQEEKDDGRRFPEAGQ